MRASSDSQPPHRDRLNGAWHEPALWIFFAIVVAHWAEHLAQAYQMYVLHWSMPQALGDRKSTRLNSSHVRISYAVFCLKKKKTLFRCAGMFTDSGLNRAD